MNKINKRINIIFHMLHLLLAWRDICFRLLDPPIWLCSVIGPALFLSLLCIFFPVIVHLLCLFLKVGKNKPPLNKSCINYKNALYLSLKAAAIYGKTKFYVGSRKFNPKYVGFANKRNPRTSLLDVSLPGNSNLGHEYGTGLSDVDKWALIEFLKSL